MDERQLNNLKSIIAAVVTMAFISLLAMFFLEPIYEHQRQTIIEEYCPNGLEDCNNIVIDPFPIWILLGMPSVIVYFISYRHFENKRIKTWKSWK